jgi:ABC-type uncharacterized transport system permease subunit
VFALEISRLAFRSGIRGALLLGFAAAGLLAHTIYLTHRAAATAGVPLSSQQDWYLVASWALVVVYLYLLYYHPRVSFGTFLMPLVLALIAAARFLASPTPFAREPASKLWGAVHGVSILLATVAVLVGFVAGVMYLGQVWRLKHKLAPQLGPRLPSLEWLDRANGRALVVAAIMMVIGVASGLVLNLIHRHPSEARMPWHDPLIIATVLMLVWLLSALVVGKVYRPDRPGRRVAYLTLASFLFLVVMLGAMLLLGSAHGGGV